MSTGRARANRWAKAKHEEDARPADAAASACAAALPVTQDALDGFWDGPEESGSTITGSTAHAESSALPRYYGSALRALHDQHADKDGFWTSGQEDGEQQSHSSGSKHTVKGKGHVNRGDHYGSKGQSSWGKGDKGYTQKKSGAKGNAGKGKKSKTGTKKLEVARREEEASRAPSGIAAASQLAQMNCTELHTQSEVQQADASAESPVQQAAAMPEPVDEIDVVVRNESAVLERESLEAIYGTEFEALGEAEWLIRLSDHASLHIFLPAKYPKEEPPTPIINVEPGVPPPGLAEQLAELWVPGEVCIYQWVEHLREVLGTEDLSGCFPEQADDDEPSCENDEAIARMVAQADDFEDDELARGISFTYMPAAPQYGQRQRHFGAESDDARHTVEILHGEPFVDRKSTFQAHMAKVASMEQVYWTHRQLLSDKKIAAATHNIVAYRFRDEVRNVMVADNDDDGETAAGGRLSELLELRGVVGVFVMVSRWFGGIQLGPDRFKHINRAAQLLLDSAGLAKHAGNSGAGKASKKKH